jgi:GT2 family glycosyltransferase
LDVSFVVPLYNCLGLTQAMVASLRASLPAGLSYEIILVDDGSSDGTREWLRSLTPAVAGVGDPGRNSAPYRVLLNPTNLGYAAANNRGAAAAGGDVLVLLNNDLVLDRGWLEPMLSAHRQLGGRAGLIGNVQRTADGGKIDHSSIFITHKGKPAHSHRRPSLAEKLFHPVRPISLMTGACVLLSRELWRELGGFDQAYFNGCEDIDLCLRAEAAGRTNAIALRSCVKHHISAAPGRKDRDEANTYRFTLRWRDRLVVLGRPDWCRHHFETFLPEPRDFPDPRLARGIFWYLTGLRRRPPPEAAAGMEKAIDLELVRWREMFSR